MEPPAVHPSASAGAGPSSSSPSSSSAYRATYLPTSSPSRANLNASPAPRPDHIDGTPRSGLHPHRHDSLQPPLPSQSSQQTPTPTLTPYRPYSSDAPYDPPQPRSPQSYPAHQPHAHAHAHARPHPYAHTDRSPYPRPSPSSVPRHSFSPYQMTVPPLPGTVPGAGSGSATAGASASGKGRTRSPAYEGRGGAPGSAGSELTRQGSWRDKPRDRGWETEQDRKLDRERERNELSIVESNIASLQSCLADMLSSLHPFTTPPSLSGTTTSTPSTAPPPPRPSSQASARLAHLSEEIHARLSDLAPYVFLDPAFPASSGPTPSGSSSRFAFLTPVPSAGKATTAGVSPRPRDRDARDAAGGMAYEYEYEYEPKARSRGGGAGSGDGGGALQGERLSMAEKEMEVIRRRRDVLIQRAKEMASAQVDPGYPPGYPDAGRYQWTHHPGEYGDPYAAGYDRDRGLRGSAYEYGARNRERERDRLEYAPGGRYDPSSLYPAYPDQYPHRPIRGFPPHPQHTLPGTAQSYQQSPDVGPYLAPHSDNPYSVDTYDRARSARERDRDREMGEYGVPVSSPSNAAYYTSSRDPREVDSPLQAADMGSRWSTGQIPSGLNTLPRSAPGPGPGSATVSVLGFDPNTTPGGNSSLGGHAAGAVYRLTSLKHESPFPAREGDDIALPPLSVAVGASPQHGGHQYHFAGPGAAAAGPMHGYVPRGMPGPGTELRTVAGVLTASPVAGFGTGVKLEPGEDGADIPRRTAGDVDMRETGLDPAATATTTTTTTATSAAGEARQSTGQSSNPPKTPSPANGDGEVSAEGWQEVVANNEDQVIGWTYSPGGSAVPLIRCHGCGTQVDGEWMDGPDGPRSLCVSCGIHYAKLTRRKIEEGIYGESHGVPMRAGMIAPHTAAWAPTTA